MLQGSSVSLCRLSEPYRGQLLHAERPGVLRGALPEPYEGHLRGLQQPCRGRARQDCRGHHFSSTMFQLPGLCKEFSGKDVLNR